MTRTSSPEKKFWPPRKHNTNGMWFLTISFFNVWKEYWILRRGQKPSIGTPRVIEKQIISEIVQCLDFTTLGLFKSNLLVLDFFLLVLKMKTLHHISVGIANYHSLLWPLVGALSWCKEDYVSCLLSNVNEAWRINSPAKLHKRKLVEGSPLATHIHVLLKESSFCFSVYHAGH